MPGIFGLIDRSADYSSERAAEAADIVARMSTAMHYNSFYEAGIVSCPEIGAWVGQVGFAGDDLSSLAQSSDWTVLTAGQVVAENILRAYEEHGEDCFADVSGAFAAFLIDRRTGKCLLVNDRYGMERLFLYSDGPRTYFSSEAKAILAVVPETRVFDPKGLSELLSCGCTLGQTSLFWKIEVLENGTAVTFDGASPRRRRYFTPSIIETLPTVTEDVFLDGFFEAFHSAVNAAVRCLPAAGISLTGGLDSRMLMACLDAPPGTVPCYTFGSMFRSTFDVKSARRVAACCGHSHQVIELGASFLGAIGEELERAVYVSDGYLGLSGAAELYLNRLARSIAPARVTGNWGGELLRGVRAFKYIPPKGGFLNPALSREVNRGAEGFQSGNHWHPVSYVLFHQMPMQGYGRYAIERSQVVMRAPFLANHVVEWLYQVPSGSRDCSRAIIGRRPELLAIPTDRALLGTASVLTGSVRRLYRKCVIKAEYLTSHGAPDWLAAISARLPGGMLETRYLGRDKFQHFRRWLRKDIAAFMQATLFESASDLADWFDMPRVHTMVNDHVKGLKNYTTEIDQLLTIAIAQRTLLKWHPKETKSCRRYSDAGLTPQYAASDRRQVSGLHGSIAYNIISRD